jgi:hypothetical protein
MGNVVESSVQGLPVFIDDYQQEFLSPEPIDDSVNQYSNENSEEMSPLRQERSMSPSAMDQNYNSNPVDRGYSNFKSNPMHHRNYPSETRNMG